MANPKPVTEEKLISALNNFRTDFRKDIQKDIEESTDKLRNEFKSGLDKQSVDLRNEFKSDLDSQSKDLRNEFKSGLDKQSVDLRNEFKSELDKQSRELRSGLNEDFLETLANYHKGETLPKLDEIEKLVESLDQRLKWVKRDLKDIEVEFITDKASKKEFNELFSKVISMQEDLRKVKAKIGLAK